MRTDDKIKIWLEKNGYKIVKNAYLPHSDGLIGYSAIVEAKAKYSDGATYVFVLDCCAYIATLPTPTLKNNWQIVDRVDYDSIDELKKFLDRYAVNTKKKNVWEVVEI